jgi:hypothetical protein
MAGMDRRRRTDGEGRHEHERRVVKRDLMRARDDRAHAAHHQCSTCKQTAFRKNASRDRCSDAYQLTNSPPLRACDLRKEIKAPIRAMTTHVQEHRDEHEPNGNGRRNTTADRTECRCAELAVHEYPVTEDIQQQRGQADVHDRLGAAETFTCIAQ